MSNNIVDWPHPTRLDVPAAKVLTTALEDGLVEVLVIGVDENGREYFRSSVASGPLALWHIERAKLRLLRVVDEAGAEE